MICFIKTVLLSFLLVGSSFGSSLGGFNTRLQPAKWRVAVLNIPPNSIVENGHISGYNIEVIDRISKEAGLRPQYVLTSRKRALDMVLNSEVDAGFFLDLGPAAKDLPRVGIFERDIVIVTRARMLFADPKSFTGTIGRIQGTCSEIDTYPHIKPFEISTIEQGYKMLQHKRIDGCCLSFEGAQYYAAKLGLKKSDFPPHPFLRKSMWLYLSKNLSDTSIQKIKKSIQKVKRDKGFDDIVTSYNKDRS
jgi:ABC-type amino acid transport substrate-binding protein